MYKHSKDNRNNTVQFNQSNEDKNFNLTVEIECLKTEIVNLKSENDRKIKAYLNIHLLNLKYLHKENISINNDMEMSHDKKHNALGEAHAEEVNG